MRGGVLHLIYTVLLGFGILLLTGCLSPKETICFQARTGWKIEHETNGGIDFYSVEAGTPDRGLLIFSKWPVPGNSEDQTTLLDMIGKEFLKEVKKNPKLKLASESYQIQQFKGEQCQGRWIAFEILVPGRSKNPVQAIFLMSVDDKLWNGQFTGEADTWDQVLTFLKSIKPLAT